jgi:hypothetical protein
MNGRAKSLERSVCAHNLIFLVDRDRIDNLINSLSSVPCDVSNSVESYLRRMML